MPRRFPLYAKILLWFFLNLALLAALFCLLFRAQFHFGLDWLLSDRVGMAAQSLSAELGGEDRAQWDSTLQQTAADYHNEVRFLAFGGDGVQLAGEAIPVPPEIREQMGRRRGPPPLRPMDDRPGLEHEPPSAPPIRPRRFIHTSNPSRYWVMERTIMRGPEQGRPVPVIIAAVSDSFAGGGLFFDLTSWLAIGAGAVFFSVLLWLPLVRDLNRAIAQLTMAASQIAEGKFDVRVDQKRRDELGALGFAINQMAARLNDLVAGQKRFLGDVAHELCSPLAKLRVSLGILDQQASENQKPYVAGAEEEAAHMAALVNELLSFSKASFAQSKIELCPVAVLEVAEKAVKREAGEAARVVLEIAPDLQVMANPELLLRALSNLLRNAVRYAGKAGPITIAARGDTKGVSIVVSDCGRGVPEVELSRIFDPFYRVDASRDRTTGGTGLGLAIVKTCVESCGGTVTGRNCKPSGLEVTVRLEAAGNISQQD